LPWWCRYSCCCTWLYRLCTRARYVNCHKSVCMILQHPVIFTYIYYFMCFFPQACTWKVYIKYQASSPRCNIWGDCTIFEKLFSCQTLNYQLSQVFLNNFSGYLPWLFSLHMRKEDELLSNYYIITIIDFLPVRWAQNSLS
jgi:hypothetical protein